jgi:uncharacterized protein (UPF0332 family)
LWFIKEQLLSLSAHRLEKAKDDLESSESLFELGKFAQSINRSYYAMFHAVRAILALDKFDSKKHSGVISYFILNYVKAEKVDEKFSKMLTSAEKIRINSDYSDFYIVDKETAEVQLNNAKSFLIMIEELLEVKKTEVS